MAVAHLPSEFVVKPVELMPSTTYTDLEDNCDVRQAASLLQRTQGMSKSPIQHVQHDIVPVYEYEKGRLVAYDYDTKGNLIGHLIVPRHLCQGLNNSLRFPNRIRKYKWS